MTALLCVCACPDDASARSIAEALVRTRLAACVNLVGGVRSIYRWQDEIEQASEVLLLVKTARARWDAVRDCIHARHPYELPEIIAFDIDTALPAYLDWIVAQTTVDAPSAPQDAHCR